MPEDVRTVVLADDEEDYRFVLRQGIERGGRFRVLAEAGTALEALELATEHQPGVLLLDLGLPDQPEDTLIGDLLRAAPQTMIAIMTGRRAEEREPDTRAAGAFTFYEKDMIGRGLLDYLETDYALFERAIGGEDVVAPSAVTRRVRPRR